MTDMQADHAGDLPRPAALDAVIRDLKDDIAAGRIQDDVSTVLRTRVAEAGLAIDDEALEPIASDVEIEVSR